MKPKARKFRIKRSDGSAQPSSETLEPSGDDAIMEDTPETDGTGATAGLGVARRRAAALAALKEGKVARGGGDDTESREGEVSSASEVKAETDLDAIKQEGLTGRQLRMARRVAQKHGLAPTSDYDAVRQLRARGFDPF